MDYEQPMFHFLMAEEIVTHDYGTWPAGTTLPIPQEENQFNLYIIGPISKLVEPPAQFEYSGGYGQMVYEQPMFQFLMAKEIITYGYDTWPVGTWVTTLHRDNPFCGDSVGQIATGYLQYPPQLEWMNSYQW
jgi:hypothetical protein